MDAEEILSKHTGETGIYLTKGMIRGSDALEAMEEHTSMKLEEKDKEINRLENILNEGLTNNVQMVEEISTLQSELEEVKRQLDQFELNDTNWDAEYQKLKSHADKVTEALEMTDILLSKLEDYTHGEDGNRISQMRKVITEKITSYQQLTNPKK